VSQEDPETALGDGLTEHATRILVRRPDGGFTLSSPDSPEIRVVANDQGWGVEGPEPVHGCGLTRGKSPAERYVLRAADGETEAGRSSTLQGTGTAGAGPDLVMDDGRVYRVVLRGPADARFELLGWEASGAYLTARPGPQGWAITPEPAASGLPEIRPLLILFAAEVLHAEETQGKE
jgi:hypothetical protein